MCGPAALRWGSSLLANAIDPRSANVVQDVAPPVDRRRATGQLLNPNTAANDLRLAVGRTRAFLLTSAWRGSGLPAAQATLRPPCWLPEVSGIAAARTCFFIGIFEKETDDWVGQIYVGPTNWELPEFTIGYVVDVNHEGQGYITEAVKGVLCMLFDDLGAHRVRSECNDINVRSYRVLERCGFTREGHFRENKKNPDGTFHGDYHYGLLRREFESLDWAKKP